MYDIKEYYEAQSVEDAIALRMAHPQADIIAGGSDVLVQMREGKRAGHELISIFLIDDLRGVSMQEDGSIRIGSLTSFSHITADPIIREKIPALGEAVDLVGGPQIRNIGTIGGNTCNGVTSAESSSTLHAYEAVIELMGPEGVRRLPIRDFYLGPGRTDIREGEIQTAILIPEDSWKDTYGYYYKYAMRQALDIATTGCSVNVRLSADRSVIDRLRIAYGVQAPVPVRAVHMEEAAAGMPASEETIEKIAPLVMEDISPRDSWRASKALREHVAVELAGRCSREALGRAGISF